MKDLLYTELQCIGVEFAKIIGTEGLTILEAQKIHALYQQIGHASFRLASLGDLYGNNQLDQDILSQLQMARKDLQSYSLQHDRTILARSIDLTAKVVGSVLACVEPVEPWPKNR